MFKFELVNKFFLYRPKCHLHFLLSPVCRLTVHRLAARTLIRSLEMEEREDGGEQDEGVKKKVVELSVQSGVSSAFTAFIAVNKSDGEAIQGPLVRRVVPVFGECYPKLSAYKLNKFHSFFLELVLFHLRLVDSEILNVVCLCCNSVYNTAIV